MYRSSILSHYCITGSHHHLHIWNELLRLTRLDSLFWQVCICEC